MIRAALDKVIVKPINKNVVSEMWVTLDTRIEKQSQWEVIAVWSEVKDIQIWDLVRFTMYATDAFDYEEVEYQALKEWNILAINRPE